MGDNARGPANEARPARRRAPYEAPQQPDDQPGQDRAAGPDVPGGVMVMHRPPAECDQSGDQPVDEPDRQVPDRLRRAPANAQCFISARYLSWQALQAPPSVSSFALSASTSPVSAD